MGYKNPEQARQYHREWSKRNKQKIRDKTNQEREHDKEYVFLALGNKCFKCSLTDRRVLQVDHIDRNLRKTTKFKRGGKGLYAAIRRGEFPLGGFQLLCANCNWIKRVENKEIQQRGTAGSDEG